MRLLARTKHQRPALIELKAWICGDALATRALVEQQGLLLDVSAELSIWKPECIQSQASALALDGATSGQEIDIQEGYLHEQVKGTCHNPDYDFEARV